MMANQQPYRSLSDLRKKIDAVNSDDCYVIERLEEIRARYSYSYTREITKPRTLYSMMVKQ